MCFQWLRACCYRLPQDQERQPICRTDCSCRFRVTAATRREGSSRRPDMRRFVSSDPRLSCGDTCDQAESMAGQCGPSTGTDPFIAATEIARSGRLTTLLTKETSAAVSWQSTTDAIRDRKLRRELICGASCNVANRVNEFHGLVAGLIGRGYSARTLPAPRRVVLATTVGQSRPDRFESRLVGTAWRSLQTKD
jgi:hypothetical protein